MTSSEFRVVPPSLHMWETFYHPRRFFCAHRQPLPVPAPRSRPPHPRSMQQPTFVFFLSSSLFWTSHMNGIIQYVIFCICLSLSIMFLRFISVPFMGIGSDGKESACNEGDLGSIPGRRKWQPTPVFLPGEPLDKGAWWLQSVGSQRVGQDWATEQVP